MKVFIVITGLDGSGTSTVAKELNKIDKDSVLLKTPSIEFSGRDIIDTEVRETSQMAHYLFYLSSVIYMSDKIKKSYNYKTKNVYCVRYLIDTIVSHQVAGLDVNLDYSNYGILKPDLTIFVSLDEKLREKRISKRGKSTLDKLLDDPKVRESFLEKFSHLLDKDRTIFFDNTEKNIESNILKIYDEISKKGW